MLKHSSYLHWHCCSAPFVKYKSSLFSLLMPTCKLKHQKKEWRDFFTHSAITHLFSTNTVCQQNSANHLLIMTLVSTLSKNESKRISFWCLAVIPVMRNRFPVSWPSWMVQRPLQPLINQRHELAGLFHTMTLSALAASLVSAEEGDRTRCESADRSSLFQDVPTRSVSRAADTDSMMGDKRVFCQSSRAQRFSSYSDIASAEMVCQLIDKSVNKARQSDVSFNIDCFCIR